MSNVEVYQAGAPALPWSPEQLEILKNDLGIKKDSDLAYFAQVATHKGLDPFLGEIVAVYRAGKMIIQETVEGLRTIAERSGLYGGFRGPQFTADGHTWSDVWLDTTKPPAAARYWVIRKDWTEPAPGTARWASSVQLDSNGKPAVLWRERPDEMLGKTAEVRALKRAFPKEFARAGISVRDLSEAQVVTMEARAAGLDDDARHAMVAEITAGRTESTTELTEAETLKVRQEVARRTPGPRLNLSPACSAAQHSQCPGYYKTAHTCECDCHKRPASPQPDAVKRTIARGAGTLEARLEMLDADQMETIKFWRRKNNLARPVGGLNPDERARIAAELDRRGWAGASQPSEEAHADRDDVDPGGVVEAETFDDYSDEPF